jgi:peptide/nickel transport system ATP-binding protein
MSLLAVEDLTVHFRTRAGRVRALDRVSLSVAPGEILGVVGESGSGKSVTAYAVMRLLDPAAEIMGGAIRFDGADLATADMRQVRGRGIGMVFQSPRTALNPIRRVGEQVADVLVAHAGVSRSAARARAVELLREVRIADPERRARAYPFELSGGMCQRVTIAIALAGRPKLLIADEPTTGLDVTVQAAVLALISEQVAVRAMGCVFITHDLLLAAEHCTRIAVMHAGQVVEVAPAEALFARPRHPYTARLLATAPRPGTTVDALAPIAGSLPDLRANLPACRYLSRCERAQAACAETVPVHADGAHRVHCMAPA